MNSGIKVNDNNNRYYKKGIRDLLSNRSSWILVFVFGLILYSQLMTQQLVNAYDGLWEYTYHAAGKWELSLGRWFWLYLDKIRFGVNNDPWTSIMTILLFSAGLYLISDLFRIEDKKVTFLFSSLFISSTAVCVSLSYRFMSPVFGFAFLLSVLAAWFTLKSKKVILPVLAGSFMVALSMGAYQACLGCTCLVIAGYLLWKLNCPDVSWRQLGLYTGKSAAMLSLGGILYVLLLKVHLAIFNTPLSNYNGADSYSLWNTLKKLPVTIKNAYSIFGMYFFKDLYKTNLFQRHGIYLLLFVLAGLFLVIGFLQIWKRSRIRAVLYLALILVLPIAANAVSLVATDVGMSIQMTAPLALFLPILICVAGKVECGFRAYFPARLAGGLAVLAALWGNIYQVQVDQNAMYEGKTASGAMAEGILHELAEEDCLNPDLRYCLVGIPAGNRLFYVSEAYGLSNNYAMVGVGWTDPESSMKSWRGIFHYFCGVNLNIWPTSACQEEIAQTDLAGMPVYPDPGYVKQVGDVVVIKVN